MHRSSIRAIGVGTASVVASLAWAGCVDVVEGCEWNATCPAQGGFGASLGAGAGGAEPESGAGGAESTGGDGDSGSGGARDDDELPPCTELSSNLEALCIDERHGVFVSAAIGSDKTGDGTRRHPYASLGKAIAEAAKADTPSRVYVCADAGDYEESVRLDDLRDGLEIYGAFACADWSLDTDLKARITSPERIAWSVSDMKQGLRLENVEIRAADAHVASGSSFGMMVRDSKNVVLRNVTVIAGKGADGAPGAAGGPGEDGATPDSSQAGTDATCGVTGGERAGGSWPDTSPCGSRGGNGGTSRFQMPGDPGLTGLPTNNVTPMGDGMGGHDGADGQAGASGVPGANGEAARDMGSFHADGFTAPRGGQGAPGFPGQGGGGGGAGDAPAESGCIGASGGAGGMGGCGGKGGTGGWGGGASVALLSWQSSIRLDGVHLIAGAAGAGGQGGDGGPGGRGGDGAPGGSGDTANGIGHGGEGGPGGDGGQGGGGAGGNGGPSFALVCKGEVPELTNGTTLMSGTAGPGGQGGVGADGNAPPGHPGLAGELLELR